MVQLARSLSKIGQRNFMTLTRRNWMFGAGLSAASALGQVCLSEEKIEAASPMARCEKENYFRPQAFGARADGASADTAAIQAAIDAAYKAGGGTVYLSAGRYLSGTLFLRSHVSVWLDNGVTLLMSVKDEDFRPDDSAVLRQGEFESDEKSRALLFGDRIESVRIYGEGTIEGNRKRRGGPKPLFLRDCSDIVLQDILFRSAPNYAVSLYRCSRVRIEGTTILNGFADGMDLDCCRQVRITGCLVESIDDSLCLKASQPTTAQGVTEQIAISDCVLRTASIHFKCGTESCGDFRDITVANCTFEGGMGVRHGNPGIALYTVDGGNLESVAISNIVMRNVATPFAILLGDRDAWHLGRGPGKIRGVSISHVIANGARFPSVIAGLPNCFVEDLRLSDITVRMQPAKEVWDETRLSIDPLAVVEQPKLYPEPTMFGPLPSSVLYMRHLQNVELCHFRYFSEGEGRVSSIFGEDLERLHLELSPLNEETTVSLHNVRDSYVEMFSLGIHTRPQLKFSGRSTIDVLCQINGNFDRARQIHLESEVASEAITIR